MTTFYMNGSMNMYAHQNKAETVDFCEGCLQDSFVLACKRGYAFCYEHFLNAWSSNHLVKFAPYKDEKACSALWEEWENFVAKYQIA